ncbi:Hypothetical predicted protein [Mytilus galloprovincialis]|uniref:C2H2-type domain-containing protein n=1 Tax=Mytilus galloprovincialis TaxID=29158 RepID=A0A8B6GUJ4_MYTGA|nr:Hypothetical predicted protein [Mytilus galloprovincialis]
MSEISVVKFVIPSEEKNPEYWPDEGMSCEVKGCETPVIKSIGMYCKHTKKTTIIICRLCQRKLGRRCYLLQHLRDFHKLNIKAHTEEVLNTIPQLVDNMNYIDPGKIIKRVIKPKINVQAREAAKKERRILSEQINKKELFPNLHGAVIVPRDHEAYIFQMPNIKGRQSNVPQLPIYKDDKDIDMLTHNLAADIQAIYCMPRDGLTLFSSMLPVYVVGDGKCLPRSDSVACFGNETAHKEIRARSVVEMCLYKHQYVAVSYNMENHPNSKICCSEGKSIQSKMNCNPIH